MGYRQATVLAVALMIGCLVNVAQGQGCVEDVFLVLDGSTDVGTLGFESQKLSVENFINNTYTNYPNVNIGFLVFSTSVVTTVGLTSASNQASILASLRAASFPGGVRNLYLGIDQAAAQLSGSSRPRDIVIVSAGQDASQSQALASATTARNSGITIWAVGVEVNLLANPSALTSFRQELQNIAPENRASFVQDFAAFSSSFADLPNTICKILIVTQLSPVTVFTTQTVILTAILNQAGITSGVWLKAGVLVAADPRYSITRNGQVQRLTIVNAQTLDNSLFTFRVGDQTSSAQVTVTAGIINYPRQVTNTVGTTITLTVQLVNQQCSPIGTWTNPSGGTITIGGRYQYTVTSTDCRLHTLTISGATFSDVGTYRFTYQGQTVDMVVQVSATATPINGGFGQWSAWVEFQCEATCGSNAIKTIFRSRECNNPFPQNGGANCTAAFTESTQVNCGLLNCPIDGGLSQWSAWNSANVACPQTCGTNAVKTVQRTRTCTAPSPQFGGAFCTGALFERQAESCGLPNACPTPVNGGVSEWNIWFIPSCSVTCGIQATKTITRTRTCTNPAPSSGGLNCVENLSESAVINCGLTGCPVNGGVSQWEQWDSQTAACPVTCGVSVTKIVQRIRRCDNPTPQNGGLDCTETRVQTRSETCSVPICSFAINGGVSQWSAWNTASVSCPVTCGSNAQKTISRTRLCNNPPPSNGGRDCLQNLIETANINCQLLDCPIDGGVSQWEAWNTASVPCPFTCGVSVVKVIERVRRCNNPTPSNGGAFCTDALFQTSTALCNTPACAVPINGGVSQWGAWSDPGCGSVTCGNAFKNITKFRTCTNPPPSNGGVFCTDPLSEVSTVSCGLIGCPINGGVGFWSAWGAPECSLTCGIGVTGRSVRTRACNNPSPQNGGLFCTETLTDQTLLPCNLPACPAIVDGGVSQWTAWTDVACSVTCGADALKTINRTRACNNPFPSNGGRTCQEIGLNLFQSIVVNCGLVGCPVNGGVSQWGQWSIPACTVTCGLNEVRTISRSRTCTNPPPSNGGLTCIQPLEATEFRSCGLPECPGPVNGGFTEWTQWTTPNCGPTCGNTLQTVVIRFRSCTNPLPRNGGLDCTGDRFQNQQVSCGLPACPIDGGLSQWSQWVVSTCPATCGQGILTSATRTRTCTDPVPSNGGRDCSLLGSTFDTETRQCNLPNCPINGGLTEWNQWTVLPCGFTCGSSLTTTATRRRFCTNPVPQNGGLDCSFLGSQVQTESRSCGLPTCAVDGGLSLWTQWSVASCIVTCGQSVTTQATRTRGCTNPPPSDGGRDCTGLGATFDVETRSCNLSPCPINGGLSFWTQWSVPVCTATCGVSQFTTAVRTRSCTNPVPQFGGNNCALLGATQQTEQRSCNLGNCPIDGGFTQWTAWNFPACVNTCGLSQFRTVTRRRTCTSPVPQFGGRTCQGNDVESYTENCGLPSCAVDGGISQWTAWVEPQCVITCGPTATFIAYRQRFCNNPSPREGGRNCSESRWDTQVRNCGLPACPVDGGVTQWTQWAIPSCPASCGRFETRTVTRSRTCANPTPSSGGLQCSANLFDSEIRSCNLPACPVNGGLGQWTQWAIPPCSRTCGASISRVVTRYRFCDSPYPQNGGSNCTDSLNDSETRNCGLPLCTVNGGFTIWSQWSLDPCTSSCGINVQTAARRFRTCTNPVPQDGGFNCTGAYSESTFRGCNLNPCPINGGLTFWTQWSVPSCGVTCGNNRFVTAHRTRSCTNPIPRYGGFNCTGSLDETESRSCNLSPCPVDGGLTQWSGWTGAACIRSCGTSEIRTVSRTRECTNPPASSGGQSCVGNLFQTETRNCGFSTCPIDGGISQWTQWSNPPCSITCGPSANKVVSRTRVCNSPFPQFGGRTCNESRFEYDVRSCNLGNCPVNGGVTLWTQWSDPACPLTCGVNLFKTVRRTRTCTNPVPQFNGLNCSQPLSETITRLCNVPACAVDGGLTQWTLWSNPPCAVTCGTAATRTVQRTRTCTNPVPSNGGMNCTGEVSELDIRSCNLQRCPVTLAGLCQDAQIVNGVGYRYHPTDCDKYIQCYYNPNGYVIGAYRSCPFGYYWDQRALRCDFPWKVNCPLEKCTDCVANYNLEGSCRAHWVCEKGVSRADCCPMGFRYVVGQGCKPDFYCRDTCPTPCASRDVCDKRPDWNNNPLTYNISVGLLGWLSSSCVGGNYFDLLDCGCGVPTNASCTPDYSVTTFDSTTMASTQAWMSMTDVDILNGYAVFNGIGHMFVNVTQKSPAVDCPLVVRFTFTEAPFSSGRKILASTSDCYKANTLVIAMEDDAVVFEMKSIFGQMFRMPLSLGGFSSYEWKTVTMVYDGKMVTAVVESNNLKYMQWQFAPEISLMECGLRFGSDGSMSSTERFNGQLQSFTIYRCNPGGLY